MDNMIDQIKHDAKRASAESQSWVERFIAQVEFARGLGEMLNKRDWAGLIGRAERIVADACGTAAPGCESPDLPAAVGKAESLLAPIGKVAKSYTIHCVGHAHIDMNWMWSWPETVAVTNDTFLTVLKLMDEFDDFTFSQSQASVYRIIAEHNPAMLAQIKKRVAQGRWEVPAVTWVEGDQNLAGGEAMARHLLYTRAYIADMFGLSADDLPVQWEPDTFGHAWTVPTISARGGVRCYYMCRGGKLIDKPPLFWWEGPDGSRILVNLETTWYNDTIGPHNAGAMLKFCGKTGLADWLNVYGVGDHGGGPTRRDIVRAREMDGWPIYPNFRFSTGKAFFDIALKEAGRRDWPVIRDELNLEFAGCYTTQTQIKRHNRRAEAELAVAESAAVIGARAAGCDYPADRLREAWINTLFGHFHDILPGSGVRATREYQSGLFQQTIATTTSVKSNALRAVAGKVDTSFAMAAKPQADSERKGVTPGQGGKEVALDPQSIALGGGVGFGINREQLPTTSPVVDGPRPFVIFNPTAWQRTETVTLTVWDWPAAGGKAPTLRCRRSDGTTVAAQKIGDGKYWGHEFAELAVPVTVDALGYSTCLVEPGEAGDDGEVKLTRHGLLVCGPASPLCTIENEFIIADFDRETGGVVRLIDKATGCDLACPGQPMGVLEYVLERPIGMSAWTIADPLETIAPLPVESLAVKQAGPHVAGVVAKLKVNDSTMTITYTVRAGQPGVEVAINANWLERGGQEIGTPTLRMAFPAAIAAGVGRYEIPFGSIERKLTDGQEVPALRWGEVVGASTAKRQAGGGARSRTGKTGRDRVAMAVVNDCKHGYSLEGSTLRVTLIRSSFEPDPLPEIGEHDIRLMIVPRAHAADETASLIRLAAGFNQPLQVVPTDVHDGPGSLPAAMSGVAVSPASIVLTGVKRAEEGQAIVLRLQETAGKSVGVKVQLNEQLLGVVRDAVEVDLLERAVAKGSAKRAGNGFTVRVPAGGIASVKVAVRE